MRLSYAGVKALSSHCPRNSPSGTARPTGTTTVGTPRRRRKF